MTIRRILRIDDPEDKAILQTPCRPVKLPDPRLKPLIDDMFETMHAAYGVGLAAPQIGLSIQLAIVETPAVYEEREDGSQVETEPTAQAVLINPRIVKSSDEEIMRQEGCLSLPLWYGDVPRATWVTVEFQDLNGKKKRLRRAGGFLGWAIQHEVDHLNGILFTERIVDLSTLHKLEPEPDAQAEPAEPVAVASTPDDQYSGQ